MEKPLGLIHPCPLLTLGIPQDLKDYKVSKANSTENQIGSF